MNKEEHTETSNLLQGSPSFNQTPITISAAEVKKESLQTKSKQELKADKKKLKKDLKKSKKIQKVDYINLLLILTICLLLTIIITPPILRKLMPKTVIIQNPNNEKIVILSCVGVNVEEHYRISSRTKYLEENIKQNIITYTKLTDEELTIEMQTYPPVSASPTTEMNFFQTIKGLNIDSNQTTTIISIQDYMANKNTSNFKFMNYFQGKEEQKAFYTSQGFSCTEIKD